MKAFIRNLYESINPTYKISATSNLPNSYI